MAKVRCPHCRRWHDTGPKQTITFQSVVKQPYKNAASAAIPLSTGYKETPVNMPTLPSHIYVPLADMLVSAALLSPAGILLGVGGAWLVATSGDTRLTTAGYVVSGLAGWGAMFWLSSIHQWFGHRGFYRGLLFTAEEYFQADIDGDGNIGEPEPPPKVVEVELRRNGLPWKFESLEISRDKLIKLARAVASGQSFSNRTALDAGISREDFVKLRDKFVSRGLATWKGEPGSTQGVELTDDGLDTIAEIATTPLPRAGRGSNENRGYSAHPLNPTHENSRIGKYVPIE